MSNFILKAENVTKFFGRRLIFNGIDFEFQNNGIYGIAGPNGSGKSTLVKIIAGITAPSSGNINRILNNKTLLPEEIHNHIGFVSPYLVLYEEFSLWENLLFFAKIRDVEFNEEKIVTLLEKLLLIDRKDDLVKTYSSGMKQRFKFIFALMHSPELIILDEPTSNLDLKGKNEVYKIIQEESINSIVIIASNEESDLELCQEQVLLENYKNKLK